jgi:hypothetical protein
MSQYAVRVQLVLWFEIVVDASSAEEAIDKAENLPPYQICTKGKKLKTETGLADPDSAKLVRMIAPPKHLRKCLGPKRYGMKCSQWVHGEAFCMTLYRSADGKLEEQI